jgi:hypothetical protein
MLKFALKMKTFPSELPVFIREHQNGMYMTLPYYIAKVLTDVIKTTKIRK